MCCCSFIILMIKIVVVTILIVLIHRWLHCECDGLTCEDEAELAADYGYHCIFCRPRTGKIGPCKGSIF